MGTLTKRQIDFTIHFVESRNIFQSAISAGYSKSYAKSKSHLLLKNPLIMEQITHLSDRYYKEQFQELALDSIKSLKGVINDAENRSSQLSAIKYTLDASGVVSDNDSEKGEIQIKIRLPHDLQH